jgi:hypothetical protein
MNPLKPIYCGGLLKYKSVGFVLVYGVNSCPTNGTALPVKQKHKIAIPILPGYSRPTGDTFPLTRGIYYYLLVDSAKGFFYAYFIKKNVIIIEKRI